MTDFATPNADQGTRITPRVRPYALLTVVDDVRIVRRELRALRTQLGSWRSVARKAGRPASFGALQQAANGDRPLAAWMWHLAGMVPRRMIREMSDRELAERMDHRELMD